MKIVKNTHLLLSLYWPIRDFRYPRGNSRPIRVVLLFLLTFVVVLRKNCQQRPSGRRWDYGAIKGSPWLVERFPRGPWTSRIGREKKCQLINEYYWELRTQFSVLFRHVLLDKFQNNRKFWVFCQSYNTPDDERQNITSHCHGFHFYRDKPAYTYD